MGSPVSAELIEAVCGQGGAGPVGRLGLDGAHPGLSACPADEEQAGALLLLAAREGWAVVPRGSGTKDRLGAPLRQADLLLSTSRLNAVVEYEPADLTVTAQAGMKMRDLQALLAAKKQRLPLDAPDNATVGGVVASGVSGPLRYAYGGPRDLVLGLRVALTTGNVITTGARVVKNVAGYDLNKLFTGSMGTLGLITQVTFKVYPVPAASRFVAFEVPLARASDVMDSELEPESLDWFSGCDCLVVGLAGELETVEYQASRLQAMLGAPVDDYPHRLPPVRTILKASLPPSALGTFVAEVERVLSGALVQVSLCGIARVAVEDPSVITLSDALNRLAESVAALGGHLTVEDAPAVVKSAVPVWGAPGPAFALMGGLKQRFDPHSILNPGRFVGGL